MNRICIIGDCPLKESIRKQYLSSGIGSIEEYAFDAIDISKIQDAGEYVILTSPSDGSTIETDAEALALLKALADAAPHAPVTRPVVHLLLQSPASLRAIQMMDLPAGVEDKLEVYPFTMEDIWAKNVLVQLPGIADGDYRALDREGIGKESRCYVHIVLSGFNAQAESIAIYTALTAHYPNYRPKDKFPLRTRITIIEEGLQSKRDAFISRYQSLFDNSFYRTVDVKKHSIDFHRPMYAGKRSDFVDVEWEFVDSSINNPEVRRKIHNWVNDYNQLLTFFVCGDNDAQNLSDLMSLPKVVFEKDIPVIIQQSVSMPANALYNSATYNNIRTFGMKDCGYDVSLPLVKLAKLLAYAYDFSYNNQHFPTKLPIDKAEKIWKDEKSFKMRCSCICNVMTIAAKMRSLGHDAADAGVFYALTQSDIESLSETEHNRWSVERLVQGARPCTDEELADIRTDIKTLKQVYKNKDIHFDLRAYDELEEDGTGRNVKEYDYALTAIIPLMVKTFYEKYGHGE